MKAPEAADVLRVRLPDGDPLPPGRMPPERSAADVFLRQLAARVEKRLGDPASPWALDHGLIGFGPDFRATDGRRATDVIASVATREASGRIVFPVRTAEGGLADAHPHSLAKGLLDQGFTAEHPFTIANGTASLREIVASAVVDLQPPATDAGWRQLPWQLEAAIVGVQRGVIAEPKRLRETARAAVDKLERETAFLVAAMEKKEPGAVDKKQKAGIFTHPCGGQHLVMAALRAAHFLGDEELKKRMNRQLDILVFRHEVEHETVSEVMSRAPEHRALLQGQLLKFDGHALEALVLADRLGFQPAGGVEAPLRRIAQRLAATVALLGPEYGRLDTIRGEREQTYLDLIGDAGHALAGLRGARAFLPLTQAGSGASPGSK